MNKYRNREIVSAEKIEENGRTVTRDGVRDVLAGEWLVYGPLGTFVMTDEAFTERFAEWPEQTDVSADIPVVEFDPAGKTVDVVLEYFKTADADEIERVKALESIGGNRVTILNYSA